MKPCHRLLWIVLLTALLGSCAPRSSGEWSEWQGFADRFMSPDGRIVDITFDGKTTSEGQSYAMFFALVANRRDDFDKLLRWTDLHLADGRLGADLPAWHWGQDSQGQWGVRDRNSASDADLWIAYALLQAGRIWGEPRYQELGLKLLRRIGEVSVVDAGEAGPVLLPGQYGFAFDGRYRINPSYLPGFMLKCFAWVDPAGPWAEIWTGLVRQSSAFAPQGIAPNWYMVGHDGQVWADTEASPLGSYDEIGRAPV
jgi:endoglucanase